MKPVLFIAILLTMYGANSQTKLYQQKLEEFQIAFNAKSYVSIYDEIAPEMQKQIPLGTLTSVLQRYRTNLDSLQSFTFVSKNKNTEVYKGKFKNGVQDIAISVNTDNLITGFRFLPTNDARATSKISRNKTLFALPFKGEWFTFWGGDTKKENYHVVSTQQKHAFDFLILGPNNKTYKNHGTTNEDYYAFGKPLYAICDATVHQVITGIEDNKPTQMNAEQPTGNTVVLKTNNEEYIFYAHFKKGSIVVKEGQKVKKGELLGQCGNSGNSSEAHLHLHLQDGPNLLTDVGVKCFFKSISVNGEIKNDYSPVRFDKIAPSNE